MIVLQPSHTSEYRIWMRLVSFRESSSNVDKMCCFCQLYKHTFVICKRFYATVVSGWLCDFISHSWVYTYVSQGVGR